MENIKRACALGGVSIKQNPTPTETTTGHVVPFMPMKDKQNLKTVKFQDEVFRDDQFNQIKEGFEHSALGIEEMVNSLDRLTQVIEKQYKDNRSRGRDRRNDRRNNRSRSNSYSSSRSRSRERSNSRDRNSRDRNRNQMIKRKGKILELDILQIYIAIIVKCQDMIFPIVGHYKRISRNLDLQ